MMKEATYRCLTDGCGHTQTIRLFPNEAAPSILCCVKCRAGYGYASMQEQYAEQKGMVLAAKPKMVHDDEGRLLGLDQLDLGALGKSTRDRARA